METIKLHDGHGNVIVEISENLLRDFYDEVFIEEKPLLLVLSEYTEGNRMLISQYIIHRLAMVDPGYQPDPGY